MCLRGQQIFVVFRPGNMTFCSLKKTIYKCFQQSTTARFVFLVAPTSRKWQKTPNFCRFDFLDAVILDTFDSY